MSGRRRAARGGLELLAASAAIAAACHAGAGRAGDKELARLAAERRALQEEVQATLAAEDFFGLASAPDADVVIGVSAELARDLLSRAVTGLMAEGVALTLHDLKIHYQDDVTAKMLFGRSTLGAFQLDLTLEEVSGRLRPGAPRLSFSRDAIAVRLPVALTTGSGRGVARFRWQGKGLAGAVCGDADLTREVASELAPRSYVLEGRFKLSLDAGVVVATPDFGEPSFELQLAPTDQTWKVIDAALDELRADKNSVCGTALARLDIVQRLKELVARGFNVTLPKKLLRPIRLPAGIEQTVTARGTGLSLAVTPAGLVIAPDKLWYGADVAARAREAPLDH